METLKSQSYKKVTSLHIAQDIHPLWRGTGLVGEGKGGKGNQTMSLFWNSFEHLTSLMASLKILYDIRKYYFHNSFCNKVNL